MDSCILPTRGTFHPYWSSAHSEPKSQAESGVGGLRCGLRAKRRGHADLTFFIHFFLVFTGKTASLRPAQRCPGASTAETGSLQDLSSILPELVLSSALPASSLALTSYANVISHTHTPRAKASIAWTPSTFGLWHCCKRLFFLECRLDGCGSSSNSSWSIVPLQARRRSVCALAGRAMEDRKCQKGGLCLS